jgi:type I restriction enzyme R subunit
MNELLLQDKYLIKFLCDRTVGLGYKEVKANTVSSDLLLIEDDLKAFLSNTPENKKAWKKVLPRFDRDEGRLLSAFIEELQARMLQYTNVAIFLNNNRTFNFEGQPFHLFYPSGSSVHGDTLFEENIFSVVQEMTYRFMYEGDIKYTFRPDVTFFLNGMYLGYTELKSNYNNQSAWKNGRKKVLTNYEAAVEKYLKIAQCNDVDRSIRRAFLKIFHKAIHITTTDLYDTYVIRDIAQQFDAIATPPADEQDRYAVAAKRAFKPYPLRKYPSEYTSKTERFEEVFRALYSKKMIEKEILYYNFIEREMKRDEKGKKYYHDRTGRLIAPRPKQKFGTDKIIEKIDEFLEHEKEPDYFINKLRRQIKEKGIGDTQAEELIEKRQKYLNNKNVYSLLLQYAAGFGKSNIIGWTALQLKDLRHEEAYVYDKIMLVVDRLQLRDQLDSKMHNMNIQKGMFIEAKDKRSFLKALEESHRIVVVNLQKFGAIREILSGESLERISNMRVAFLIDEIHRSHSGAQSDEMVSLFDELQNQFDQAGPGVVRQKKNLIVGFTATPSDHSLTRFGEFDTYAESERIWTPFDSYTMREAIEDGYILNPLNGLVPVSAKMFYELPEDPTLGLHNDDKEYRIRNKKVYENEDRIEAISKFIVDRLLTSVFPNIRGQAKAMLAVYSIDAAITYHHFLTAYYTEMVATKKKYERFSEAPIFIVYTSDGQKHKSAKNLNGGLTESQVLQKFQREKNGLIIVVDKLQTGFDEPKLHTLFLDKEIRHINAIQTISRVNRTTKYKNDCKIVDFSYRNVNITNIHQAFEHFSNVVASDFDPLAKEEGMKVFYEQLTAHRLYENHFEEFVHANSKEPIDLKELQKIESVFTLYIEREPEEAEVLKKRINRYFRLLHLIEFIIAVDARYQDAHFMHFWRLYNNIYNTMRSTSSQKDDIEIYYDYKIGIISVEEPEVPYRTQSRNQPVNTNIRPAGDVTGRQVDIFEIIEQRNQEEEAIEQLIDDFKEKIELFYQFLESPNNGSRLLAKMQDESGAFTNEEIFEDFERLYKRFVRRHRSDLSDFFKRESAAILQQLLDGFEERL